MNKRIIYPLALLVLSVLSGAIKEGGSCITGKCHNKMGETRYLHSPIAAGECAFCR